MAVPSTTIRPSRRERTHARLLANAVAMFRERGVRGTRLAEVAEASDVSPASLYNHYPTKGSLAEAWLREELAETLADAMEEARGRGRGLRAALRGAARRLAEAAAAEPALRLEAWRETGRSGRVGVQPPAPLVAALGAEQESERVRRDLPAGLLAAMLVDAVEGGLVSGLVELAAGEPRTGGDPGLLERAIRSRVDLVLDGARKRNERVRAPMPPGSADRRASGGAQAPGGV